MKSEIKYMDWGLTEYNEARTKQETLFNGTIAKKLQNETTENYLIFCEHAWMRKISSKKKSILTTSKHL